MRLLSGPVLTGRTSIQMNVLCLLHLIWLQLVSFTIGQRELVLVLKAVSSLTQSQFTPLLCLSLWDKHGGHSLSYTCRISLVFILKAAFWMHQSQFTLLLCFNLWGKCGRHSSGWVCRMSFVVFWKAESAWVMGCPEPSIENMGWNIQQKKHLHRAGISSRKHLHRVGISSRKHLHRVGISSRKPPQGWISSWKQLNRVGYPGGNTSTVLDIQQETHPQGWDNLQETHPQCWISSRKHIHRVEYLAGNTSTDDRIGMSSRKHLHTINIRLIIKSVGVCARTHTHTHTHTHTYCQHHELCSEESFVFWGLKSV